MNFTNVILGSSGFEAAGFAKSVVANQLGFDLQKALWQTLTTNEQPTFDASIVEAMGDLGLPTKTVLNADELTEGYAAAFVLLVRHIKTNNPENGRKPEHLMKYIKSPDKIIRESVDYRLTRQEDQIKASATMFKADPSKRLEAVKKEAEAQAAAFTAPVMKRFVAFLKEMQTCDNEVLLDKALDALTNAGRNIGSELKRAAQALIDAQKKRFEAGDFAMVDPGIFALAQATGVDGTPLPETSGEMIAKQAAEADKMVSDHKAAQKKRRAAKRAARKQA